ncbi:protein transport protein Sec31A-like isoform X2 [Panulirus ornatus]|uniref:protein transport protein Sec31A-like isoform X2 n=1 Tax=Panulirus ornatus TaxID=150431 RepID=UPI003A89A436
MKVKEVNETANVAWSPAAIHPMYLACGTTAKQLDASFNTSSTLNIYSLNAGQSNLDMVLAASVESPARFHALQWSGLGGEQSGLIYGGCENGSIYIYDAAKLLAKAPDCLVGKTEGLHPGPVFTLSCNYLKANFVACGSSDSEVTVWDITNLSAPIIPGKKLSLGAEVSSVDFNRQVEHIFASTCAGHCVVWDLRKHSSIMTISDSVSRMKASSIVWNPNVATQLLLASDSDVTPWAQVWDLRYASSPIKTLEGHQRGVLKSLWCAHDGNLLITTAKDNKIYVWNPNEAQRGSEIVGEFPSYNQWSFDIDWGKRDPSLVATASVDGCVSVYSLLGGGLPPTQSDKFSQIADSFPGMEMPTVVPQGATPQHIRLKNPPKWFPQTAGASFAFGGQLVSWNNQSRRVEIARVVTEQALVERSSRLEEALSQPHFAPFCQAKAEAATQPSDQILWQYIGANFESSPRSRYMELLGYSSGQVASKIHPVVPENGVSAEVLADKMENLGTNEINEQEEVDTVPSKEMQTENEETEAEEPFDPFVADDVKKQLPNSLVENSERECPAIPETPTEAEDINQGEREITKDEEEVDSLPSKGMQSENEETVVEGEPVTLVADDVSKQLADSPFEDSERDLPVVPEPTTEAADIMPGEREITEDEEEVDSLPSKGMQSEKEETVVEGEPVTLVADDVSKQLADSPFEDSERNLLAVPELPTEAEDKTPGEREGSTSSLDPSEQFEMIASGHSFDKTPETEVAEPEVEASMPVVSLEVEEKEENSHGMITQALLVGDLESAVDLCIKDRLFPHALTLAAHAGPELFSKTRDAVLDQVDGSLSSLVGAIVHGDLTSISTACNLSRWKEALVAALTYSNDEQFPSLAGSLGERLEAKGDAEALLSALICYVCAGSLEKFVSCWIKTRPETNKPSELQDLVEIIMGLQRSLAATGRSANISEGSTVSSLLCQYASLLAAQGALNTAVSYLNSATQGDMVELRDRLYRALGYTTGSTIQPSPQIPSSTTPQTSNLRRTSTPHSINQPQFVKVQQPSALLRLMPSQFTPSVQDQQRSLYGDPSFAQSAIPPPAPGFYSPAPPVPSVPPVPPVSEVPPMMVPQYGVQTPVVSMQPTPPPPTGPPPSGPVMSGGFRRGGPGRYVQDIARPAPPANMLNPAQPPQPSTYLPPVPGANPVPLNPSQPTIPAQTPPQFFSPAAPPTGNPVYGDQQQQPSAPQPQAKTPAAFDSSVPRGWNDPPPLSSSRKLYSGEPRFHGGHSGDRKLLMLKQAKQQQQQQQQQQNEAPKAPEPIMCPVPGSVVPEPPQQFMGFQHPQYGSEAQGPGSGSAAPVAPTSAPEPASKGPLPPEHQVVQDVITEVQNRCLQVVQNQQMKQRLEDIGVKMEALYDKLRAGQLGPIAVSGVHRIVSAVQSGDYRGALSIHAETIGKGSFSELSSFMPSVKLLLQYCMQLQVFL